MHETHHVHNHHYHPDEDTAERLRRIENMLGTIHHRQETLMSTLEELTAVLSTISTEVDKVSADTDNLLAKLAAIPTGGLTPEQQAAIDSAVTSATAIADRLKAIDDKVPDAT